jgi:hypothetical protein
VEGSSKMQQDYVILQWLLDRLEALQNEATVLVRDPLHLLAGSDNRIHAFASEHQYTVIMASTNLAFRDLYERARVDPEVKRLLIIDQTPQRRLAGVADKAPPIFYPDLLERVAPEARITLDLRQILVDLTRDPDWPREANEPAYARLILEYLPGVLRAHENLRVARRGSFSDDDFRTIVAYAALGVADKAFSRLDTADYWRVGLLGQHALTSLETLTPKVTEPIKRRLAEAPAPFCWFGKYEPETVLRAFYLSVILAQHLPESTWRLVLVNADPTLSGLNSIQQDTLEESARKLVELAPEQAKADLQDVEAQLSRDALKSILLDQLNVIDPQAAAALIEKEGYSTLFRNLALLCALADQLSARPDEQAQQRMVEALFEKGGPGFVEQRPSLVWSALKEAYRLASTIQAARKELARQLRQCRIMQRNRPDAFTFTTFSSLWNSSNINRLEYYLSALKRLVDNANLLERDPDGIPAEFPAAITRLRERVGVIEREVFQQLNDLNTLFQDLVARQYPDWLAKDEDVRFSSQFIRRCLKPYWDPQKEKAVVLVFDGMRYDIWDELLRPTLLEKMEVIEEFPASSILPSETHVSRWAIAAGSEPAQFGLMPRRAESDLLREALQRELRYRVAVNAVAPPSAGTGETVRYQAGNLEYYIFEFCDKELHKVEMKELPDGRREPSRPLAFVYQQYVKNLIDTEVSAIIRQLAPGTKIFVVADHGFGRVGQNWLGINAQDLNEPGDCNYLHCLLKVPVAQARLSSETRRNIIAFTPDQLGYPRQEISRARNGTELQKRYQAMLFPRVGYSFSRPGSPYRPGAYSHGGISLQEMLIPMIVLRVKEREEGLLIISPVTGQKEIVEGEDAEFRLLLQAAPGRGGAGREVRVDIEASYGTSSEQDPVALPQQAVYVSRQETEIVYRFRPDTERATPEERRQGVMERDLMIVVRYQEGGRLVRRLQRYTFAVRLNSERVIRRVPASLGTILGLTPRSMR